MVVALQEQSDNVFSKPTQRCVIVTLMIIILDKQYVTVRLYLGSRRVISLDLHQEKIMQYRLCTVFCFIFALTGCAGSPSQGNKSLEKFNRTMFDFNYNVVDPNVLRPVAVAWRNYVPKPARNGLSNFLGNWSEPSSMVNYLLEGNVRRAMIHFTRFMLNTTLGLGGLIDVASMSNETLAREERHRFGSTLGHYNVAYGPYVQLPGYGSFTPREDVGGLLDQLYPPLSWLTWWAVIGKWALEGVETRAQLIDSESILNQQNDRYRFIRAAYFQQHDFLARGGSLKVAENPNEKVIEDELNEIDAP